MSRPNDLGHLGFSARLSLDYANSPLVYEGVLGDGSSQERSVVEHMLHGQVGLGFGLFDRLVIYAALPVTLWSDGEAGAGDPSVDGTHVGDMALGARVRLFGEADEIFALGLQATVTFPIAELASPGQSFAGDRSVTFRPRLMAELRLLDHRLRIGMNVGARIREEAPLGGNQQVGHELTFGFGLTGVVVPELFDLGVEFFGATGFEQFEGTGGFFGRESTPFEVIGGPRFHPTCGLDVGVAAGGGLVRGYGSPAFRAVLQVGYAHGLECSAGESEPGDRDGDGLPDDVDQCPDEAEDRDGFQDEDGCPDPDNDGDGVPDTEDECPNEPGPAENRGCPDTDRDGDGVVDREDACPNEPGPAENRGCPWGDRDGDGVTDDVDRCPEEPGPAENEGCPWPDRDGDGVPDRRDNCPDEPGPTENQGCPEAQQVRIEDGRLEILDVVYFRTNRATIERRSFGLLENVARVLNAHPEIERVRVEGHTDSRGRRERNVRLSQERAEAVVRFLTTRGGVDASRLEAQGFGPDRPLIEEASTTEEHAQNRRVEFNIVGGAEGVRIESGRGPVGADTIDR